MSQFTKLRHSAGNNVESYLTKRWEEIQKHVSIRYQEAEKSFFGKLVYYIWRVLLAVSITYNDDETNTYNLFLQSLVSPHEDFGFINFNYDTLLDKALKEAYGLRFSSLDDYLSADYVKPHGSVNWLMSNRTNESSISFPGNFFIQPRYDMASTKMFSGEPVVTPWDWTPGKVKARRYTRTKKGGSE